MTDDAQVVFTPSGRRGRFAQGTSVLEAARALGVDLDSVCGGRGLCGRCQVIQSVGEFSKHGISSKKTHLSAFSRTEQAYEKRNSPLVDARRLGCSAKIEGDVVIDVPADSQVHRQVVRKRAEVRDINVDPVVRLYYVEVQEPNMYDPTSDFKRLIQALEFEWRLTDLRWGDLRVLQRLQAKLREGEWKVTVAVHNNNQVIGVWPGFVDRVYGVAVDLGSTTIAAHLCDLSSGEVLASGGVMNPQIRFGEDLMSRVSYVMMNPDGVDEMTRVVRASLVELTREIAAEAGVKTRDIMEYTIVGNPVMHHLLLGINPIELGGAPFALATDDAVRVWAGELDLDIHRNGRVYVLPCIAGHVGADAAAVLLSEAPHLREEVCLIVDVGTNAEIILGNNRRLLAASSPTGPAFEGAQISCGQRAAPGAIERVRIDPETLEPKYKVIGCDLWSTDEGFAEASKVVGVTGVCGSGIIEVVAEMFLAGIITEDGVIDGACAGRNARIHADGRTFSYLLHTGDVELKISQNDIRQIQLAKAALYAGVRLLMDHMYIDSVERIRLAGAFGSHIDVKYAMVLGMIPDCKLQHVTSAGNAAGTGARIALLDKNSREELELLVRDVEKIETAVEPKFQEHFVDAMAIPHKTAAFVQLGHVVKLPQPSAKPASNQDDDGRRRRRARKR